MDGRRDMRERFVHQAVLITFLLCKLSTCLATETPYPSDPNRYLNAVRTFADNVLKYGRDTYGPHVKHFCGIERIFAV